MKRKVLIFTMLLVLVVFVTANTFAIPTSFGSHFRSWLNSHGYGSAFPQGGFGGRSYSPSGSKQVVVFIHGNGSIAWGNSGDPYGWKKTYDYLKSKGWNDSELYAVNYPYNTPLKATLNNHSSDRINIVKKFIQAVYAYTGKKVNVIAHSLGCTMTRKAMVDGNLYSKVRTFISISGGNHGLSTCGYWYWGIYYCVATPTCYSSIGFCQSPYLTDFVDKLNSSSQGDYEMRNKTTRTYVIRSSVDEICLTLSTPALAGAYKTKTFYSVPYGHFGCKDRTAYYQYKMIMWSY